MMSGIWSILGGVGPAGPAGTSAPTRKWAYGKLSVDQTTNIADENPVKLDTWAGTLTTDAVNYRVTLEAGKRYYLEFTPGCLWSNNAAYVDFKFRDITNSTDLTPSMQIVPPAATYQTAGSYVLKTINYGAAQRIIEVRIETPNNFSRIYALYTSFVVQEIADA